MSFIKKKKRGRPSTGPNKPFTFRLHEPVLNLLDEMSKKSHKTKTAIIEDAIELYAKDNGFL